MKFSIVVALATTTACGQTIVHDRCKERAEFYDTICANPVFADTDLASSAQFLQLVLRLPIGTDDCDDLWKMAPVSTPQANALAVYPVLENQYPGAPLMLSQYTSLVMLLYAYDEVFDPLAPRKANGGRLPPPIAGGCVVQEIPEEKRGSPLAAPPLRVDIPMDPPP